MYKLIVEQFHYKLFYCHAWYSTRVRFAPSPTGQLHVGGLKTALINYLFAKSSGGKLIFRLEDTDQTRYNVESVEQIIKSLSWFGIEFDEGVESGKPAYDYIQSQRLNHYHDAVDKLVIDDKAYRCFCSQKRLDFIKKEQSRLGQNPGYDRKCSQLTSTEISHKIQQGIPYVIRLRVTDNVDMEFTDQVFGRVSIPAGNVDIDPILIKADRYPVYHLANVVDDHLMDITHVIRGQEWLLSTPKHISLYKALGWQPPHFAHLPLIMKEDGFKVSKRDPNFHQSHYSLEYLIDKGYPRESVISWLMSCGGGLNGEWHPDITLPEIIAQFSLSHIITHNASLNEATLRSVGRSHLGSMTLTHRIFDDLISPFLAKNNITVPFEQFQHYFEILKHRITCLSDITEYSYLWTFNQVSIEELTPLIKSVNCTEKEAVKELLERLLVAMQTTDDYKGVFDNLCKGLCSKPSAMKCLRKLLINRLDGPKISELMQLISKDEIVYRINSVLK